MKRWTTVVGVEVHARVASSSKLFSGAASRGASRDLRPNTCVSLFDAAHPGTLPFLNEECVNQAMRTAIALRSRVNMQSVFERKHYYYCDLPHGYQITQQRAPIAQHGVVDLDAVPRALREKTPAEDNEKGNDDDFDYGRRRNNRQVRIARIQLEQDSGKTMHEDDVSLVDLNRAGVGLMEIVSEPDMRSSQEAAEYVKCLHDMLKHIGTCEANMEKGDMRVDVNVSVHEMDPEDNSTGVPELRSHRVEIKNLNSFRSVERAVEFEADRLTALLEEHLEDQSNIGSDLPLSLLVDETRTFDATTGATSLLRRKDGAEDYRFFIEPDLPPLIIAEDRMQRIESTMPELMHETAARLTGEPFCLSAYDVGVIMREEGGLDFFTRVFDAALAQNLFVDSTAAAKAVVNWICNELLSHTKKEGLSLAHSPVTSDGMLELIALVEKGDVTHYSGKHALRLAMRSDIAEKQYASMHDLARGENLIRIEDSDRLIAACGDVLSRSGKLLENYAKAVEKGGKKGKKTAQKIKGGLFGLCMKATEFRADPADLRSALDDAMQQFYKE